LEGSANSNRHWAYPASKGMVAHYDCEFPLKRYCKFFFPRFLAFSNNWNGVRLVTPSASET